MSISLNKKTGINLKKGGSISLEKKGKNLEQVCIGLNWGSIVNSSFWGLVKNVDAVDLDGTVTLFDDKGKELDTVYYQQLLSKDRAIKHSGDDLDGDVGADDGKDNEIISLALNKINPKASSIFFYLNSYQGHDFSKVPFSKIRIYEGLPNKIEDVMATFDLSSDEKYHGYVSMIMGRLDRQGNGWKFTSLGEPSKAPRINDIIKEIQQRYFQ